MAKLLHHEPGHRSACGYLPGLTATTEYRLITGISPVEYDAFLIRGWRRFGHAYFRPVCPECHACVGIRIPVQRFTPSKSQRRTFRKFSSLEIRINPPTLDSHRLRILHDWHANRETVRNWSPQRISKADYQMDFCAPHSCAREMSYFLNDRLVAIGLVDETGTSLSSVYFYYDPVISHLSPGTAGLLTEIEYARTRGLSHLYLGYRITGCPSSFYKSRFRPHELLFQRPDFHQTPHWLSGTG